MDLTTRISRLSREKRKLLLRTLEERNIDILTLPIPRQERKEQPVFPLSFGQERLWFVQQLDPGNVAYNITRAIRLKGKLSTDALKRSLHEIVRRHEILRTRFVPVDEKPVQEVLPELSIPLEVTGMRDVPADRQEERLQKIILDESRKPFDLVAGPLLRTGLYDLNQDDHVFLLVLHHIVSDGVSISLIIRELAGLYQSFAAGTPPPPADLPLQYADYAYWQRQWFCPEAFEAGFGKKLESFWLEQYRDGVPRLPLPTDYPGPRAQSFEGGQWIDRLEPAETRKLKQLVLNRGTTLFTGLLTIYYMLLAKLSGADDIVVGTPVTGRRHPGLRDVIGMFVNMLPLRNRPRPRATFGQFLDEVGKGALAAFEHQDYRYEDIVEKLNIQRDTGDHSMFDVTFSMDMDDLDNVEVDDSGFRWQSYPWYTRTAKFDLVMVVQEENQGVKFTFEYSTALFDKSTVERYAAYFKKIAAAVVEEPQVTIGRIDMLPAAERESILNRFNRGAPFPRERTLTELFEARAGAGPHLTALVETATGDGPAGPGLNLVTYSQLNRRASVVAGVLREKGAGPGTITAIVMESSIQMVVAMAAILKAGGIYLPIDPLYPDNRIDYMIEDSGAGLVLTHPREEPRLKRFTAPGVELLPLGDTPFPPSRVSRQPAAVPPGESLCVIYTSGSTGRSKGVLLRTPGMVNLVWRHREVFGTAPGDHISQAAGPAFDAMALDVWPCLSLGGCLHLAREEVRMDPEAMQQWLIHRGINICFLTTPMAEKVIKLPWPHQGVALRWLITGGDRLNRYPSPDLPFRLENIYGPTENTVLTTWGAVPPRDNKHPGKRPKFPSIGRPITNHRVYILDSMGKIQPIGVAGELYAGGAGLSAGYLNRPELTAEKFLSYDGEGLGPDVATTRDSRESCRQPGGPSPFRVYRTGDLARWLPDGNIEFLGRIDFQVKVRGFRIEPQEIAHRILELPGVRQAAVIPRGAEEGEKYLCAYMEPEQGCDIDTQRVREQLSQVLPHYMIPAYFTALGRIPLTANGKIDRKALEAHEPGETVGTGTSLVEPANHVERAILEDWKEVLKKQKAGVLDNFFESGGHSIKAMALINRILKAFNTKISIRRFHENPTVRALAEYVRGAEQQSSAAVEPAEEREFYPLSASQKRMFILNQFIDYGIPVQVVIQGPLDRDRFETAIRELILRHESLRTSFNMVGDTPYQFIHPGTDFKPEYYRVEESGLSRVGEQLEHFFRPFELSQPPLFRLALVSVPEWKDKHILLYNIHHLIVDGTSLAIFAREFWELYGGRELPAPTIRYRDFALWENQAVDKGMFKHLEDYWLKQFSGELPVLEMPTDFPRPPVQRYEGANTCFEVSGETFGVLNRFLVNENAGLYMVLLAVYNTLLYRYTHQEDIVVGTISAGRQVPGLEELTGIFINTLAMRNHPRPGMGFRTFLQSVKVTALEAFEHGFYPFGDLLEKVTVKKDISRSPLFDVMLILQNMERPGSETRELHIHPLEDGSYGRNIPVHTQHDIVLWVFDEPDRLRFSLDYSSHLFRAGTMRRLSRHFINLLGAVLANPLGTLDDVEIMDDAEKKQVLETFNHTSHPYPGDWDILPRMLERQVEREPHRIALVCDDASGGGSGGAGARRGGAQHLSYFELDNLARQLARRLMEQGVTADTIAGILLEPSMEMFVALLGIMKAGGAYLPLDPGYPPGRIRYMLEDSGCPILVTGEAYRDTLSFDKPMIMVDAFIKDVYVNREDKLPNPPRPGRDAQPGDLAYVIYTSGSTGKPKGVLVEHRNIRAYLHAFDREFGFGPGDTVVQQASFSFDTFGEEVYPLLIKGGKVVIPGRETVKDIDLLSAFLMKHSAGIIDCSPLLLNELNRREQVFPMHTYISGGDVLKAGYIDNLARNGAVYNTYGPTETTICAAFFECPADSPSNVPIGNPIANYRVYILDRREQVLPVGIPGELCIAGDGVARGYLNRPQLTSEKFLPSLPSASSSRPPRLYKSGDLARWLPDGNIEFMGRIDEQVKIRGYRIELGEIERLLARHDRIGEAVVIDWENRNGDKVLCAFIVARQGEAPAEPTQTGTPLILPVTAAEIKRFLALELPQYMIPVFFIAVESIPRTSSGKIDKKTLRQYPVEDGIDAGTGYVAPANQVEKELVDIWTGALSLENIGTQDDFFQLGGQSITAMRIMTKIQHTFDVKIPLGEFFQISTIKGVAGYIQKHRPTPSSKTTPTPGHSSPAPAFKKRERRERRSV